MKSERSEGNEEGMDMNESGSSQNAENINIVVNDQTEDSNPIQMEIIESDNQGVDDYNEKGNN